MTISNLSKKFGKKILFQNFSLNTEKSGIIALWGESGKGKTTLLRMIAGLDKKYSGKIDCENQNKIAYVFQEARLLNNLTALENVSLPLGNTKESLELAKEWLIKMGLEDDLNTYPEEMSGGMKQRVSLARAFAYEGDILLLDEPFNGIDPERTKAIMDILLDYSKTHLCILVTHNKEHIDYLGCTTVNI
ncbi:MAG: ABC transporter ATP-binding protein [Clostridia bacterium]|nr:ABC transporter ATP-binding protein [Clostridia bacterium]